MNYGFEEAFEFVLGVEGPQSNLKGDPGGWTIWGIASKWHPKEVAAMAEAIQSGHPEIAKAIAKRVYFNDYWLTAGCDHLPWPMSLVIFDSSVNHDPKTAKHFGQVAKGDWRQVLVQREAYYDMLARKNAYGKSCLHGWINRLNKLGHYALETEHA